MCPHCGQNAPLVYKGVNAFCSACGQPRIPFTANAVNLRGKPATIGGTLAAVAGWIVLFGALAAALIVGAILQAIFPPGAVAGWVVGGVIAVLGIALGVLLLLGGTALRKSGANAAEAAKLEALTSLAAHHRGIVTVDLAVEALGATYDQADAFLTALAKRPDSGVTLEVNDDGKIYYRFARFAPAPVWPPDEKLRVDATPPPAVVDAAGRPVQKTELGQPAAGQARVATGPAGTKMVPGVGPAREEVEVPAADEAEVRGRARS